MTEIQKSPLTLGYADPGATLPELLGSLWRHKWCLALPVVITVALGVLYTMQATPVFEITARVLVKEDDGDLKRPDPEFLSTQAQVLGSPVLIQKALDEREAPYRCPPEEDPVSHVHEALTVKPIRATNVISVVMVSEYAEQALGVVEALLDSYRHARRDELADTFSASEEMREIEHQLQLAQAAKEDLNKKVGAKHPELLALEAKVAHWQNVRDRKRLAHESLADKAVQIIEQPQINEEAVWPRPVTILCLSTGLGLIAGFALLVLVVRVDQKVETADQVRRNLGLPILGNVPNIRLSRLRRYKPLHRSRLAASAPGSNAAEAIRAIRARLHSRMGRKGTVIQFASPAPGEGKSTITALMASSIAQLGKKVVVIDADLRRGSLHEIFAVSPERGLTSVLCGEVPVEAAIRRSSIAPVDVLARGPNIAHPGELLAQPSFGTALETLRNEYDVILIDSPALLVVADAAAVAWYADEVVLVLQARKSTLSNAHRAAEFLSSIGVSPGGVVLNRLRSRQLYTGSTEYRVVPFRPSVVGRLPQPNAKPIPDDPSNGATVAVEPTHAVVAGNGDELHAAPLAEQQTLSYDLSGHADRGPAAPPFFGPALDRHPRTRKTWMARLIHCAAWLNLLLVGIALLGLWLLSEQWWLTGTVTYLPRLLFVVPSLLLLGPALVWNWRALWLLLVSAALVLGPMMDLRVPWQRALSPSVPANSDLSLLQINARDRPVPQTLLEQFRAQDPDLIAAQAPQATQQQLRSTFKGWNQVSNGPYWVAARWPLRLLGECTMEALGRPTAIGVEVDTPDGPVQIYDLDCHSMGGALGRLTPAKLWNGTWAQEWQAVYDQRRREAQKTRSFVSRPDGNIRKLVVGAFNMPSSSSLYRTHWGDFRNAFDTAGVGYGYAARCDGLADWLSTFPWMRTDHVLLSQHWDIAECHVERNDDAKLRWIAATISPRRWQEPQ